MKNNQQLLNLKRSIMQKIYRFISTGFLSVLILVSCQKDSVEATKLEIVGDKILVGVGRSETVYANPFPSPKKSSDLNWSSDDVSIVKVDQNGSVTGVSIGSTYVNVKFGSLTASVEVEVYEPLTDIKLTPTNDNISLQVLFGVAESFQFTYAPLPANSSELITWTSSNINVATVSNTGYITAVGTGNAIVTVSGSGGKIKKEINVSVTKIGVDPVKLDRELFLKTILPGDNYQDRSEWWKIEGIWNGNKDSGGGSSCSLAGPQSFTFDLGVKVNLAFFHLFTWKSISEGYGPFSESNVKKFEVWGAETLDESGSWDSWTKLMDCEVNKPSGLPLQEYNNDDVQASNDGQKFYNSAKYDVPLRYLRVKVLETWEGTPCWRIGEIELFGSKL